MNKMEELANELNVRSEKYKIGPCRKYVENLRALHEFQHVTSFQHTRYRMTMPFIWADGLNYNSTSGGRR
jgi:hypothetical protein